MNKYNPNIYHRRSVRLKGYDYLQAGLYFITICTQNREHFFGKIKDNKMILNDAGKMVDNEWLILPERFTNIKLHKCIIMPNYFHAILEIVSPVINTNNQNNTVGAFQSIVTVKYIYGIKNNNWIPFDGKLWQRNYWEHIIRNEKAYNNISEYIINNPKNWVMINFIVNNGK